MTDATRRIDRASAGQAVDAGEHQAVDRVRDLHRVDRAGGDPARLPALDGIALDEHPDDLFHEERVALRLGQDQVPHPCRQRFDLQQVRDQGTGIAGIQRCQRDLRQRPAEPLARDPEDVPAGCRELLARAADEQDGHLVDDRQETLDELRGRRIRPVQVFPTTSTMGPPSAMDLR